jgi:hypothetical protein
MKIAFACSIGYTAAVISQYEGGDFEGFGFFFIDNLIADNSTSGDSAIASEIYFSSANPDYLSSI